MQQQSNWVLSEVRERVGLITLNRPQALNALSLSMIRDITTNLLAWRDDAQIDSVAFRGVNKNGAFGAFCAGGDIRFFHQAALAGNPELEDFFTEEYTLNHLIHTYPKPTIAFMDGIVMGGGMGIAQGCKLRLVTEQTKMAMPETNIGLFPDVAGGYFLSRCPGSVGEYLALTGTTIGGAQAVAWGLADGLVQADALPALWDALPKQVINSSPKQSFEHTEIDKVFSRASVSDIIAALDASASDWAHQTAADLRKRSPLMLHVVLEHIRRARQLSLADVLHLERGMIRQCFQLRPGKASETVEGIRALAVDKDHQPKWQPARIEDVTSTEVNAFFASLWPVHAHPLRALR